MFKDAPPSIAADQTAGGTLVSRAIFPLAPGVAAGTALGISDVLAKLVLATGCDVLTMLSFRSVVGLAFVASWLRFGRKPSADARVRWVSMAIGIMFAGLIFCLFKAIAAIDVPTAILSYFTYPLLTGLTASLAGLEPLRWKGVLCAIAAFCGLAIMIGAHPAGLAFAGVGLCARRRLLPHRGVAGNARLSCRRRRAIDDVVFDALVDCRVHRGFARHADLASAANGARLGVSRRAEFGDDGGNSVRLRLDHADRAVPDRADHASRAADRDDPQRAAA